jgi:23S rRNA (cytidine2498-2'-O)-methyltransferase
VNPTPAFLFITCQHGAEGAVKEELARDWPGLRFAYSRPGFLTFKLPDGIPFPPDFDLRSTFARAYGLSLGKATGATPVERAESVWRLLGDLPVEQLHVWERDRFEPGYRDFEPGMTPPATEAERLIRESPAARLPHPAEEKQREPRLQTKKPGFEGPLVADVVVVAEEEWWVGYHRIHDVPSGWPGGLMPGELPAHAVSRVYMKMQEAIVWSGFPLRAGQKCIEIGCAPGGASQALLEQGLSVVGIDPAVVDPMVLAHPQFRHIRGRSKEVRRREFVGADWLTCDINLPPRYTLDTVEAIVSYPEVRLRGLLLTLKLAEWSFAAELPAWRDRIRSWGFQTVASRQLHYNHRELCIAASDFVPQGGGTGTRRPPRRKTATSRRPRRTRRSSN